MRSIIRTSFSICIFNFVSNFYYQYQNKKTPYDVILFKYYFDKYKINYNDMIKIN